MFFGMTNQRGICNKGRHPLLPRFSHTSTAIFPSAGLLDKSGAEESRLAEGAAGQRPERVRLRQTEDVQRTDAGLGLVSRDADGAASRPPADADGAHHPNSQRRPAEER